MALKNKTHDIEKAAITQRTPPQQHQSAVKDHQRPMDPVTALQLATSAHPSALRPADILSLQRTIGNRAVQRMVSSHAHSLSRPSATQENAIQRQTEEEELRQEKFDAAPGRENRTGMPDALKSGIESLSGISMDNVKVHYNSAQPAQLDALAYTQGSDIHIGPGQEKHLAHEAWHVVQQAQGRVQPTIQLTDGVPVNDDERLEHEADVMGARALADTAQLKGRPEEEELLKGKLAPVQRKGPPEEEELLQGKFAATQLSALAYTQRANHIAAGRAETVQVVQRVLAAVPTVAPDRATMNLLPLAAPTDMGNTTPPAGYIAPAYIINSVNTPAGWLATVVKVTAADEGANISRYLGPGIHSTSLMNVGGALGPYIAGPNNKEIYGEVTQAIADVNRDAEQEHIDDFRRAYDITLDLADSAIDAAVAASPFPPQPTQAAANNAAETFMNNLIAAQAMILGTAPFLITAPLAPLYLLKFTMSMGRDGAGWHTFRPDMAAQSNSAAAWLHWAATFGAHEVRVIQQGPSFSVGVTPAAVQVL